MDELAVGEVKHLQPSGADDVAGAALLGGPDLAYPRRVLAGDAVLAVREQEVCNLDAVLGPLGHSRGRPVLHVVRVGDHGEDACAAVELELLHYLRFSLYAIASRV